MVLWTGEVDPEPQTVAYTKNVRPTFKNRCESGTSRNRIGHRAGEQLTALTQSCQGIGFCLTIGKSNGRYLTPSGIARLAEGYRVDCRSLGV